MSYRPEFTGLGILAGWTIAILGPSFYLRRRIGPRRWRQIHRWTIAGWALAVVHALGAGTDAGQWWLQAIIAVTAVPIAALFALRVFTPAPAPRPSRPVDGSAPGTRSFDLRGQPQQRDLVAGAPAELDGERQPVRVVSGRYRCRRLPDHIPRRRVGDLGRGAVNDHAAPWPVSSAIRGGCPGSIGISTTSADSKIALTRAASPGSSRRAFSSQPAGSGHRARRAAGCCARDARRAASSGRPARAP